MPLIGNVVYTQHIPAYDHQATQLPLAVRLIVFMTFKNKIVLSFPSEGNIS